MARKKKETLVHFDIDSLSKQPGQKEVSQPITLGETLRAKREKKKLSLEDVSKKLCIKEMYLKALEEGHYYAFPNHVYGIGFLRTYSKFLGLDSDLMVAEFHAETSDIKDEPLDMPVIEKHMALPSKKTLWILTLILIIILCFWCVLATLLSADLLNTVPQTTAPQSVTSSETQQTTDAPVIADEALIQQTSSDTAQQQVTLTAKNEVWVRLYNTETQKVILDKVLMKDDSFTPESDLKVLELTTGRANMLDLYKNGQKIKTFGQEKARSLAEFATDQN